jgi:transposase
MIGSLEKRIVAQHRSNEASKRLETILGIGIIGATTIAAVIPDRRVFRSGRDFAAVGRRREKRGIGELGNVGTNAAICNAIFHATGQRLCGLSSLRSKLSAFSIVSPGRLSFTVRSSNIS